MSGDLRIRLGINCSLGKAGSTISVPADTTRGQYAQNLVTAGLASNLVTASTPEPVAIPEPDPVSIESATWPSPAKRRGKRNKGKGDNAS